MSEGPIIDSGVPDPFNVVHRAIIPSEPTYRIPSTLHFSGPQTLTFSDLKSELVWSVTGGVATLPTANLIWKTFKPAAGAFVRVPVNNKILDGSTVLFTGSDSTVVPIVAAGVPIQGNTSILLKCTTAISSTGATAAFTIY